MLPVALLLAACAHPPAPLAARTDYFEGTTTVMLPGGRTVPGGVVLARRTVDPAAGTIVEQVISADPRPGRPATEYLVTMVVSQGRFTMSEASKAFEGEGALEGPAWRWTTWTSTSRLPDGSRVVSADSVVDGQLVVHKRVLSAAGAVVIETVERLAPIDAARFTERRWSLRGSPPG
jgi:hypothetical protein